MSAVQPPAGAEDAQSKRHAEIGDILDRIVTIDLKGRGAVDLLYGEAAAVRDGR